MTVLPNNSSRGKTAITHYTVIERLDDAAVIECRLETGRTHQVRVHFASIGHPLLGDPAYGRTPNPFAPIWSDSALLGRPCTPPSLALFIR